MLFAVYLGRRPLNPTALDERAYWRLPVIFYAVSAARNLLLAIPTPRLAVVSDPAGIVWRVSGITGACVLVSIFVMGGFASIAWARLPRR
jgi:hypothetical protein